MSNIKVSVLCMVYNHEEYIRKCLEGFVMQKTSFAFEVLIHDDASTDKSAEIIKEFEEKYPNIIKPIYQVENQYSKGVRISNVYQFPRAQGEYIAWCEGDDYWTDPLKLQKQIDFLDQNPEYSACACCATFNNIDAKTKIKFPNIKQSREFGIDEIIRVGGQVFATCSFVMRKQLRLEMPNCFSAKGFGDYQLFMYSAIVGKVWCIADNMATYNYGTAGSWSKRVWKNPEKQIEHHKEKIRMFKAVNEYYDGAYSDSFEYKITETEFLILILQGNKKEAKKGKYKPFWKKYRKNELRAKFSRMFPFLRKIKRKILRQK